jgi:hypothetical protein
MLGDRWGAGPVVGVAAAAPQPAHVAVVGRRNRPKSGPPAGGEKVARGLLAHHQHTGYCIQNQVARHTEL